ncbi:hypothetical protein BKA67DRAFT_551905, partial [Truncatella angustata]
MIKVICKSYKNRPCDIDTSTTIVDFIWVTVHQSDPDQVPIHLPGEITRPTRHILGLNPRDNFVVNGILWGMEWLHGKRAHGTLRAWRSWTIREAERKFRSVHKGSVSAM